MIVIAICVVVRTGLNLRCCCCLCYVCCEQTDQFEPRIPQRSKGADNDEQEYTSAGVGFDALLGGAKQAHFNMLRVWGGGIFERCDKTPLLCFRSIRDDGSFRF